MQMIGSSVSHNSPDSDDIVSCCNSCTSKATSAYTAISTQHSNTKMLQRTATTKYIQSCIKHGIKESSGDRIIHVYNGVTTITKRIYDRLTKYSKNKVNMITKTEYASQVKIESNAGLSQLQKDAQKWKFRHSAFKLVRAKGVITGRHN